MPVPVGFTLSLALGSKTAAAATVASVSWSAKVMGALAQPVVAATAGATIVAGGAYVVTQQPDAPAPRVAVSPTAAGAHRPPSLLPTPPPPPSPSPSPSAIPAKTVLYGSVVDAVNRPPTPTPRPPPCPTGRRPASAAPAAPTPS